MGKHSVAAMALLAVQACAPIEDSESGLQVQPIIYGEDDRRDIPDVAERWAELAAHTAVALISPDLLRADGEEYVIEAPSYQEARSLCPGERFSDQPAAAGCSGVLLAGSIVATAAHCLGVMPDGSADCTNNRYVLGFAQRGESAPIRVPASQVYGCKGVLKQVRSQEGAACRYDFALVNLERQVPEARPAQLREARVGQGEHLAVIGFPAGLPVKTDLGAQVIDARADHGDFFTLDSDTFVVSSGSGVFDMQGQLVGLFARGRRDYDREGDCYRAHRVSEPDADAYEEALHVAALKEVSQAALCDPSDYLVANPLAAGSNQGCMISGSHGGRTSGSALLLVSCVLALRMLVRRRRGECQNLQNVRRRMG